MHRFFYRFFSTDRHKHLFYLICLGSIIGSLVGTLLFAALSPGKEFAFSLSASECSILSVLLCGLLPFFIAELLIYCNAYKTAVMLSSAVTGMLLAFSALVIFSAENSFVLWFGILLLSGRTVSLFWLYVFLLNVDASRKDSLLYRFCLCALFAAFTLLFFYWLTEPALKVVTISYLK